MIKVSKRELIRRFWNLVDICDHNCNICCWNFIGSRDRHGYGRFSIPIVVGDKYKQRTTGSHRFSWFIHFGKTRGLLVLHDCPHGDNTSCVNPNHLWLGTQTDNMNDMIKKGRGADQRGQNNSNAKIMDVDIPKIIRLNEYGFNFTDIAGLFNVHYGQISKIVRGKQRTKVVYASQVR